MFRFMRTGRRPRLRRRLLRTRKASQLPLMPPCPRPSPPRTPVPYRRQTMPLAMAMAILSRRSRLQPLSDGFRHTQRVTTTAGNGTQCVRRRESITSRSPCCTPVGEVLWGHIHVPGGNHPVLRSALPPPPQPPPRPKPLSLLHCHHAHFSTLARMPRSSL